MTSKCQTPLLGVNLDSIFLIFLFGGWVRGEEYTNPEIYKQAFLEITSTHQTYVQIFTDDSKVDVNVAAAAVSSVAPNSPFSCRLRDHCSIYTAELQAVLAAVKQAYQSQESEFIIFFFFRLTPLGNGWEN